MYRAFFIRRIFIGATPNITRMEIPMIRITTTAVFSIWAGIATANCDANMQTFMSCTMSEGRKTVDVCFDADHVTYGFGRTGREADLALSVTMLDAEYTPWPGIGSTIWEAMTFENGEVRYETYGAISRPVPESDDGEIRPVTSGGITVWKGDDPIAQLDCDAGSVDFPNGYDFEAAKKAHGLCWKRRMDDWAACD